jgi:transposase
MLMHPQNIPDIPQQTVDVARASFPKGNIYMQIRDTLGSIFDYYTFVDLFPTNGQPAYAPWRLALVCIMQFMENLYDRQAADAVRGHIDWKYILSLPLTDPTQQTPEWKATYNQRAGIESTHSQGIRRSGLRQSRYIGLKKTHMMQVFIACALNLVRLDAWLNPLLSLSW